MMSDNEDVVLKSNNETIEENDDYISEDSDAILDQSLDSLETELRALNNVQFTGNEEKDEVTGDRELSQLNFKILRERSEPNLTTNVFEKVETEQAAASTFQTDIPEEDLEKARKRKQRFWQEIKDVTSNKMSDIIDSKVIDHYKQGVNCVDEGKYEKGVSYFTRALNLRSCEVQCFIERAEAYLQLCDVRSAFLNYKKALSLEPDDAVIESKLAFAAYLEGQCLFDQRFFSRALKQFTLARTLRKNNKTYQLKALACLDALKRFKECITIVSSLIASQNDNENVELFVLRSRLHLKFNNASLAYFDAQRSLDIDPNQHQALKLIESMKERAENYKCQAVSLALELRFGEAISKISQAIQCYPILSGYHVYRGSLHRRVNNFNEAIDDFLLALGKCNHDEDHPDFAEAQHQLLLTYNDFAILCYNQQYFDEAILLLNKAIRGEKNEGGLYINRGDCFFRLNELAFALADYEQANELECNSWQCRIRIAVVYNELGIEAYHERKYDVAIVNFNLAIKNNPKVGQFYIHRAKCYFILQSIEATREDILTAMLLDPNNGEIVPFLTRIFPGRSVKDIINSALMIEIQNKFSTLLAPSNELASAKSRFTTLTSTSARSISSKEQKSNKKHISLVKKKKEIRNEVKEFLDSQPSHFPKKSCVVYKVKTQKMKSEKEPVGKEPNNWKNSFNL